MFVNFAHDDSRTRDNVAVVGPQVWNDDDLEWVVPSFTSDFVDPLAAVFGFGRDDQIVELRFGRDPGRSVEEKFRQGGGVNAAYSNRN